jgi:hypothetical protein
MPALALKAWSFLGPKGIAAIGLGALAATLWLCTVFLKSDISELKLDIAEKETAIAALESANQNFADQVAKQNAAILQYHAASERQQRLSREVEENHRIALRGLSERLSAINSAPIGETCETMQSDLDAFFSRLAVQ